MKKRLLLDDRQCRIFLKDMIEFGYATLTFQQVRKIADEVAAGEYSETNVIALFMCQQIDEATGAKR